MLGLYSDAVALSSLKLRVAILTVGAENGIPGVELGGCDPY